MFLGVEGRRLVRQRVSHSLVERDDLAGPPERVETASPSAARLAATVHQCARGRGGFPAHWRSADLRQARGGGERRIERSCAPRLEATQAQRRKLSAWPVWWPIWRAAMIPSRASVRRSSWRLFERHPAPGGRGKVPLVRFQSVRIADRVSRSRPCGPRVVAFKRAATPRNVKRRLLSPGGRA